MHKAIEDSKAEMEIELERRVELALLGTGRSSPKKSNNNKNTSSSSADDSSTTKARPQSSSTYDLGF